MQTYIHRPLRCGRWIHRHREDPRRRAQLWKTPATSSQPRSAIRSTPHLSIGPTFRLRTATPSPTPNQRLTLTSQPPKRSATSKVRSCSHQTEATVDYPAEILKLLERNTAAGAYLSQVFTDWLDITHATLAALPAHAASAASKRSDAGTLAEDTPRPVEPHAELSLPAAAHATPGRNTGNASSKPFTSCSTAPRAFGISTVGQGTGIPSARSTCLPPTRSTAGNTSRLGTSRNSWRK